MLCVCKPPDALINSDLMILKVMRGFLNQNLNSFKYTIVCIFYEVQTLKLLLCS